VRGTAPFRILDMACGSGSFLLGAYQCLLDHCLKWYAEHQPQRHKKAVYLDRRTGWRLTVDEKKRILTTHIFGVDIDPQAVEVSKLSLLLKVLEGETDQSLRMGLLTFKDRALPNLADNIKCGNSLIGPDYFTGRLIPDAEEFAQVNAFDWTREFPDALKAGGFDCIIGNPPYIPIELMSEGERSYYQQSFPQLERKFDSSSVFVLSALDRLNSSGRLSFISSVTWQTGENYGRFRKHLIEHAGIVELVNLPFDVFDQAYVDTGIYVISRQPSANYRVFCFPKKARQPSLASLNWSSVRRSSISGPEWKLILNPTSQAILRRLVSGAECAPLGQFTISTQGLSGSRFHVISRHDASGMPFLKKGQVYRYQCLVEETCVVDMSDKPSLRRFYERGEKILIRRVVNRDDRLMAGFTEQALVFKKDVNPFIITSAEWDPRYVLAVLNSRLISYLYLNASTIATKDDFRQTTLAELRRLPIPKPGHSPDIERRIIVLADSQLDLNKKLASCKSEAQRGAIQRQIDTTDREIDRLVYDLYALTKDEIAIVEGENRSRVKHE